MQWKMKEKRGREEGEIVLVQLIILLPVLDPLVLKLLTWKLIKVCRHRGCCNPSYPPQSVDRRRSRWGFAQGTTAVSSQTATPIWCDTVSYWSSGLIGAYNGKFRKLKGNVWSKYICYRRAGSQLSLCQHYQELHMVTITACVTQSWAKRLIMGMNVMTGAFSDFFGPFSNPHRIKSIHTGQVYLI